MTRIRTVLFLAFTSLQIEYNLSQNAGWPRDRSKPFPFPIPGPINFNTSKAEVFQTLTPLQFVVAPGQACYIENTGSTLLSTTPQPLLDKLTGGILYDEIYHFYQDDYFWDLKLKPDTAVKMNGIGSPVQVSSTFYNGKYGNLTNAMTKPDGIVQIVVFIYVGFIPSFKYGKFQSTVQSVTKAGTKKLALELDSYNWFFTNSLRKDYYAYPGQYTDLKTGKKFDSSTVIVIPRLPRPVLSFKQFYTSFGLLRNKDGKPFSHTSATVPAGPRPIVHANGIELIFT